jgi:hypothetical protein
MTASEFLDDKFGDDRVHARNLPSILEEYAEVKNREIIDEVRVILKHAGVEYVKEIAKNIIEKYEKK